jgi:alpha-ribazole phosphatase
MSKQPTFIDVMRHGEPEGSCPEGGTILRGSINHVLTDKGWLQAHQRVNNLLTKKTLENGKEWDVIISSPLKRCAQFAQKLGAQKLGAEKTTIPVVIKDAWRELHYGDWEGRSTQSIWQDQPEVMEKMWQKPLEFCAPNGESVKDFSQRIEQAWLDLLNEFQGKRILLVCHGGVMRVLLHQLLLMAPEGMNRFAIPYAAMSRFRVDHGDSAEQPNQHWPSLLCHLGDEIDGDVTEGKNGEVNSEVNNESH